MVQMDGGTGNLGELAKRILLRLDDGSLIGARASLKQQDDAGTGATHAARVDVARAFEIGKLGPEHVVRMEQLVYRMNALVHGDSWVEEPLGGKRKVALALLDPYAQVCWRRRGTGAWLAP